jgi:spore coat protein A, manganese oxidase
MKLSRRNLIKLGLLSGGAIALGLRWLTRKSSKPEIAYFARSLTLPPTLTPVRQDATTDYYEITVQRSWVEWLPGTQSEVWGYNGITPGPTIRQRGGSSPTKRRQSVVRFINQLDHDSEGQPLSIVTHVHGMASLPQYDGYTLDIVAPGYCKDYHYPNDRAATLWYHDHSMDNTSRNIQMGLAGMYIVEDDYDMNLPLPKGDYDIPLILQNKRLATDGSLFWNKEGQTLYDDVDLVNGVPWPRFEVANRKYRFRILNISSGRTYRLVVSRSASEMTDESCVVIASDQGLLAKPVTVKMPQEKLIVSSAERYEVILDFSQYPIGSQLFLHHVTTTTTDAGESVKLSPVMRFDITRTAPDDSEIPQQFRPIEKLQSTPALPKREFIFSRKKKKWVINNLGWNRDRLDANPAAGATELWTFVNPEADKFHPVHVHLAEAQLLDRDGSPPAPYEQGWKDTFLLGGKETLHTIVRFPQRDGKPIQGKYMMHCHNLDHEDNAMMIQFEVGAGGPDPVSTAPAVPYTSAKIL